MVKVSRAAKQSCPLVQTINEVSRKWFLLTLNIIGNGRGIGFNEVLNAIDGISPKALSDVLRQMESMGLIKRVVVSSSPPRVRYSLTSEGRKLRKSMIPLLRWASRYTGHSDCPILNSARVSKGRVS
jgi:DNA-binding HxlR family transcriptional regulator